MAEPSRRTVVVALLANVGVGIAKIGGGVLTGSPAMLSEGAHSVADVLNEAFLLTALRRSERPADARHPFGYGMERFFWSLLAAVGIFVAGAGFSAAEAYRSFVSPAAPGPHYFIANYLVIAVALGLEGSSWLRAVHQMRAEARKADVAVAEHVRLSSDPSVKTVAGEDTAAVVGLLLAAAGLGLHQLTGAGQWEGVSSAMIAVLLVIVAIVLGRDSKGLLIGEGANADLTDAVRTYLDTEVPAIDDVVDLLTMHIGANQVLLAARVDLADDLGSAEIEDISAAVDREIQHRWPVVTQVFIDATRVDEHRTRCDPARA